MMQETSEQSDSAAEVRRPTFAWVLIAFCCFGAMSPVVVIIFDLLGLLPSTPGQSDLVNWLFLFAESLILLSIGVALWRKRASAERYAISLIALYLVREIIEAFVEGVPDLMSIFSSFVAIGFAVFVWRYVRRMSRRGLLV